MSSKVLYAIYEDGDDLLHAVEKVRAKGMEVIDCYTPYPVHGLDKAMGVKRSRLPIAAFCFAMLGLTAAITLQYYMMGYDWPMIIGGKPYVGLPAWVPVCFELSILFTAYGMGITFFIKSRMIHGIEEDLVDIRQTDNRLVMALNVEDTNDTSNLESMLKESHAAEIRKSYADNVTSKPVTNSSDTAEKVNKSTKKEKKESKELSADEKEEKLNAIFSTIGTGDAANKSDLKKIKGVGPVFEKNLNSIGIYTFEQISKLTPDTIKMVEEVTKYFPGKIERENWISQANELMSK